jgi:hypothetical protein
MMTLITEPQGDLLEWAAQRMPEDDGGAFPWNAGALGVEDHFTKERHAVFVFVETYRGIIDIHVASDDSKKWLNRNVLGGVFGYVFLVRRGFRAQAVIPCCAPKPHFSMMLSLGFRPEGTIKSGIARDMDGVMFGMAIEDCPWINDEDKERYRG